MIRNISAGIDVGTVAVRVVVGEFQKGETNPKILGAGEVKNFGMRHGYISDFDEVVKAIRNAVSQAESSSGLRIKKAFVSLGGVTLRGATASGSAVISKADSEVTTLDVNKALDDCETSLNLANKKVLHTFPITFKLDNEEVHGNPEGLHGNKLESKALLVTASQKHLEEIMEAVSEAGVTPIDIVAAPVAASFVALGQKEKIAGSALVDIGAETTGLAVYENNTLVALHTFSIGSADITNDIALGLKIPLSEAEGLKLGSVSPDHPKKKLEEIIEARFVDIFELVDKYLKKIKRSGLLPAGAILVGGGANAKNAEEVAKKTLSLPAKIGGADIFGSARTKLKNPEWSVALGLVMYGKDSDGYESDNPFSGIFKDVKKSLKSGLKQLLP